MDQMQTFFVTTLLEKKCSVGKMLKFSCPKSNVSRTLTETRMTDNSDNESEVSEDKAACMKVSRDKRQWQAW